MLDNVVISKTILNILAHCRD